VEGALAADSLIQAPRRTSATVSALMLCLAIGIGLAGTSQATLNAIQEWLSERRNADMFVSTSQDMNSHSFRFPPEMAGELARIPGGAEVQGPRNSKIGFRSVRVSLTSTDVRKVSSKLRGVKLLAGDQSAYRLTHEGKAALISGNLGELQSPQCG